MERLWWDRLAAALAVRRARALDVGDRTSAAVLVPLQAADDGVHVVYIRRAPDLPQHAGQVAFPGGTREAGDATLEATALREAHEEIGLAPADVAVLGRLDDIETVASRFVISPFVGRVPYPYAWAPHPGEVDAIFTVPLPRLLAPDAEHLAHWDIDGHTVPITHFPVGDHVIWGATHRITRSLLDLVRTL